MAARLVRNGWRVEQTSNAYILCPAAAAPATDLQIARAVKECSEKERGHREAGDAAEGENTAGMTDKTGWELEEEARAIIRRSTPRPAAPRAMVAACPDGDGWEGGAPVHRR